MATPNLLLEPIVSSVTNFDDLVRILNKNFNLIDAHNHTSLKGLSVPLSSLVPDANFNANNRSFLNLGLIQFIARLNPPPSPLTTYFKQDGEYYCKDGQNREIRLTYDGFAGATEARQGVYFWAQHGNTAPIPISKIPKHTFFYGLTARQASQNRDLGTLTPLARTAAGAAGTRTEKTVSSLLLAGARVLYSTPSVAGFYAPWVAIKTTDFSNLVFSLSGRPTTLFKSAGAIDINSVAYTLFVQELSLKADRTLMLIVKDYE